jgi:transmembrane sensor
MSDKFLAIEAENAAITWLATLNSSTVTSVQEQEFMQWLEASPLHQAAYIKVEQLWERGAVLSQLPETSKTTIWQFDHWGISVRGFAVACSCLLMLAVGLFSLLTKIENFTYQTAMGEIRDIQLQDGSHIILNTNSQLSVALSRQKRTVYLTRGEVFFAVKKDGRPFEIQTQFGVVRVMGTRFSVYQSITDAMVTVAEGRVALSKTLTAEEEFVPSIMLQANERLSLLSARAGQLPEKINANAELAWRKKQLVFKGAETIILGSPELGDREITAVIQLADLKTTLQTLSQSLNLAVEFDSSGHSVKLVAPTSSQQQP